MGRQVITIFYLGPEKTAKLTKSMLKKRRDDQRWQYSIRRTEKVVPDRDDNLRQSDDDPRNRVRTGQRLRL
jgi:hypothetical protein